MGGDDSDETAIRVREAVREDIPLILTFIGKKAEFDGAADAVEATEGALLRALFGDPPLAHVLLAEAGGSPVGFASYFFTYSTFLARPCIWLDELFVDPDMRGWGIGRVMLAHLAALAKRRGCGRVEWTAAVGNERALAFYRRNGASVRERSRLCRLDAAAIDLLYRGPDDGEPEGPTP
jgi:GNAT superfamily N-acetyltransferase